MVRVKDPPVRKGSWRWAAQVAELTAWGSAAVVFLIVHVADLPTPRYLAALALVALLCAWIWGYFHHLLPRRADDVPAVVLPLVTAFAFAAGLFALLRPDVPQAQIVYVPVIVVAGLLGGLNQALALAAASSAGFLLLGAVTGGGPTFLAWAVHSAMFGLVASISGLLARELRAHYRGEQKEQRLATAVRHRLMAVLDAVDEAIVFSDRSNSVRVINRRAAELFDLDPDAYLGRPTVELLRTIARASEDPEGFMETFQQLRDDPELEIRTQVEQLLPARRQLRLYSAPARDESGALVGRIDVYTDITEAVRRAAEIERAYEEARKTAESFQRGLLPSSVPRLPRISLVAHYVPAAGSRAVCGDFYDFVPLVDGRVALVIGDVCGIGPAAAHDAALARYTLRSLSDDEPDAGALLGHLNQHLLRHLAPDRFVRLVFVVLDPERAALEYANGGHVAPVLFRCRSGEVEWLEEGGIALGVEDDARFKVARVQLEPGDTLLLFTDGLTEAPRHGRPFGRGRLVDLVHDYGLGTPGELVQALRRAVEGWAGAELRDDLAMVACQVAPDRAAAAPERELVLPNEPARVSELRAFVASFLADLRAPVEDAAEFLLAVSEAAANAARYGRRPEGRSELRVRCTTEGERVVVSVADDGTGLDPARLQRTELPDRFASGGRGLFLMHSLCDDVDISSSPSGTTVTLARALLRPARL
jgi:serine phosphatase RsbU (regulator of sigma subunit)/anti-sigma regulatory factor (Ser/Thr protein kinase)